MNLEQSVSSASSAAVPVPSAYCPPRLLPCLRGTDTTLQFCSLPLSVALPLAVTTAPALDLIGRKAPEAAVADLAVHSLSVLVPIAVRIKLLNVDV
jgi:hypothetical protein